MTARRGQPEFGLYLKETRRRLGLSLRRVETLTDGRVRNAFLSQIENGKVQLPNVDLLSDLCDVYGLDLWNLMWRAGYRLPQEELPDETDTTEPGDAMLYAIVLKQLEALELTIGELDEVLDYAAYVKDRRRRVLARRLERSRESEAQEAAELRPGHDNGPGRIRRTSSRRRANDGHERVERGDAAARAGSLRGPGEDPPLPG